VKTQNKTIQTPYMFPATTILVVHHKNELRAVYFRWEKYIQATKRVENWKTRKTK